MPRTKKKLLRKRNLPKYWFISYIGVGWSGGVFHGNVCFKSYTYNSNEEFVKAAKDYNRDLKDVTVTNIIEFTRKQFEAWNRKA